MHVRSVVEPTHMMVSFSKALQFANQKQVRRHAYMRDSTHTHTRTRTHARAHMRAYACSQAHNATQAMQTVPYAVQTQRSQRRDAQREANDRPSRTSQAKPSQAIPNSIRLSAHSSLCFLFRTNICIVPFASLCAVILVHVFSIERCPCVNQKMLFYIVSCSQDISDPCIFVVCLHALITSPTTRNSAKGEAEMPGNAAKFAADDASTGSQSADAVDAKSSVLYLT